MDLPSPKFHQPPPSLFSSTGEPHCIDTFPDPDPLCKLNLKETSEFVKSLPMPSISSAQRRSSSCSAMEPPSTPGRPVFGFSNFVSFPSRKSFPSKWDDAEKWLVSSPAHQRMLKQCDGLKPPQSQGVVFADKSRVIAEEMVGRRLSSAAATDKNIQDSPSLYHHHHNHNSARAFSNGDSVSPEVLLTDKFTDDVDTILPNFRSSDPSKEGFVFRSSISSSSAMKDAATEMVQVHEGQHRDMGTEMTPRGSSTNSLCHTPQKIPSPPRHNTPADRSGPLVATGGTTVNICRQLQECHLAKLGQNQHDYPLIDSITSNWSSREEEEEDVSKSLRHFEASNTNNCNNGYSRTTSWEEEEKNKCCLRYQREEAKIQAWLNLENAKAEAQSRKLEVKIQKMRSNLEEKLMKRMAMVHRKAEEWRAEARQQHSEQIQKATANAKKMTMMVMNRQDSHFSGCGCFPCTTNHH